MKSEVVFINTEEQMIIGVEAEPWFVEQSLEDWLMWTGLKKSKGYIEPARRGDIRFVADSFIKHVRSFRPGLQMALRGKHGTPDQRFVVRCNTGQGFMLEKYQEEQ